MGKYNIGDKVALRTGNGGIIHAIISKVLPNGYYDLDSPHPFPLTLSEGSLNRIIVPLSDKDELQSERRHNENQNETVYVCGVRPSSSR